MQARESSGEAHSLDRAIEPLGDPLLDSAGELRVERGGAA
jgi:hypothetical protein